MAGTVPVVVGYRYERGERFAIDTQGYSIPNLPKRFRPLSAEREVSQQVQLLLEVHKHAIKNISDASKAAPNDDKKSKKEKRSYKPYGTERSVQRERRAARLLETSDPSRRSVSMSRHDSEERKEERLLKQAKSLGVFNNSKRREFFR